MYKVFVNDNPIIFTDSLKKENNFPSYIFDEIMVDEIIHKLLNNEEKGIIIFCEDLEKNWQQFLAYFKVITAGGGLVLNPKKEILFIFRGGKWDLPKGRIEKNETIQETAVREVEEECGIKNLKIEKFLSKTYHFFKHKNQNRIKETYWYLMNSGYSGKLIPQLEEGIIQVVFKNKSDAKIALKNSYANIQFLYNQYQKEN